MHVYTCENTGARPVKTNSETFKGYPGKVSLFWNETVPRISIKIIRTRTSHELLWNVRRGNGTRSNSWQDKKIPPRCQSGWELCLRDHFPLFFFFLFFPLFEGVIERGITTNSPLNGNIMYPSPLFHVVVRDNLINRRTERGNQHFKRYFPCFYVLFFFFFFLRDVNRFFPSTTRRFFLLLP